MTGYTRLRTKTVINLHAAYLHSRQPADARIALWSDDGVEPLRTTLPSEVVAAANPVNTQLLLPTEESELIPFTALPDPDGAAARGSVEAEHKPAPTVVPRRAAQPSELHA